MTEIIDPISGKIERFSSESWKILCVNNAVKDDKRKEFVKRLRECLKYEFGIKTTSRMSANQVIEKWYECNKKNTISGQ